MPPGQLLLSRGTDGRDPTRGLNGTHLDGGSAYPARVLDHFVVRVGQVSNDGLPESHVGEVCRGGQKEKDREYLVGRFKAGTDIIIGMYAPFALSKSSTSCTATKGDTGRQFVQAG